MLNLLRRFLRPTLREQLEAGVREALKRYTDRQSAPDLRVYLSTDLVPEGVDAALWARDERLHLRRFALQWAEDHGIARTGLRLELILLDTKREFAFVKPMGLEAPRERAPAADEESRPLVPGGSPTAGRQGSAAPQATLEVVGPSPLAGPLTVRDELVLGRRDGEGVLGTGDRYMSARHARFRVEGGRLYLTDLDSRNRTYLNDEPLPPHQATPVATGDRIRMGTINLLVARVEG